MVCLGLWLIVAVLAARQVAAVLGTPRGERLTDLETWVGPNGVLQVNGSLYDSTRFTGTPFHGLVLKPLARSAEEALGWGWTFGTLLLVAALGLIAARALPQPIGRRTALLAAPVAIGLLILSLPVRNTLWLGQSSIIPVLLVLLGCFVAHGQRTSGLLIGVAAALQPTLLLFTPCCGSPAADAPRSPAVSPSPPAPRSPGRRCRTTPPSTGSTTSPVPDSAAGPTTSATSPCTAPCCGSA